MYIVCVPVAVFTLIPVTLISSKINDVPAGIKSSPAVFAEGHVVADVSVQCTQTSEVLPLGVVSEILLDVNPNVATCPAVAILVNLMA